MNTSKDKCCTTCYKLSNWNAPIGCIDSQCHCHTSKDTWEEEFDTDFINDGVVEEYRPYLLKAFIRRAITTAVTAERMRLREEVVELDTLYINEDHRRGFNEIKDKVVELLENKTI